MKDIVLCCLYWLFINALVAIHTWLFDVHLFGLDWLGLTVLSLIGTAVLTGALIILVKLAWAEHENQP